MLTQKQVDRKIRGAFLPFRCALDIQDYCSKLQLKVFNHQRAGFVAIPLQSTKDEEQLGSLLVEARRRLQREGYIFNPL